jgi:hypothetical protein
MIYLVDWAIYGTAEISAGDEREAKKIAKEMSTADIMDLSQEIYETEIEIRRVKEQK